MINNNYDDEINSSGWCTSRYMPVPSGKDEQKVEVMGIKGDETEMEEDGEERGAYERLYLLLNDADSIKATGLQYRLMTSQQLQHARYECDECAYLGVSAYACMCVGEFM